MLAQECTTIDTCSRCTGLDGASSECVWCLDNTDNTKLDGYILEGGRCTTAGDCVKVDKKVMPLGITKTVITQEPSDDGTTSYLSHDKVDIKLRRDEDAIFTVKVTKKPVKFQLYFLLDLSKSMTEELQNVRDSAQKLPKAFEDVNVKIKPDPFEFGFGSFVDKAIKPFTFDMFEYDPPTYGYRHSVNFGTNGGNNGKFYKGLSEQKVSGNSDAPEGGFDAILQVLYCQQVGWEDVSRSGSLRLILMATDQQSHVAGDGIEAGLVWPAQKKCMNDLFFSNQCTRTTMSDLMNPLDPNCYLANDEKVEKDCEQFQHCYYHNVINDYPSPEQIEEALTENRARLAYVVPDDDVELSSGVRDQYRLFHQTYEKQTLASDTLDEEDYGTVVRNIYYEIVSEAPKFDLDSTSEDYHTFVANYGHEHLCTEVKDSKVFYMGKSDKRELFLEYNCKFTIGQIDGKYSNDALNVRFTNVIYGGFEVKIQSSECNCPEQPPFFSNPMMKKKCNGNGELVMKGECGTCKCDSVATGGSQCNCPAEDKQANCPEDPSNGLQCSGQGACECKICKCTQVPGLPLRTGKDCSCANVCNSIVKEEQCGGPKAGKCDCNTCVCNDGYHGDSCECNVVESCGTDGGQCGGEERGTCNKDKCACECEPPYSGKKCEFCDPVLAFKLGKSCGDDSICGKCTKDPSSNDGASLDTWGCDCCFAIDEANCKWCPGSNQCVSHTTISEYPSVCSIKMPNTTKRVQRYFQNETQCPLPPPGKLPVGAIVGALLGLLALLLLLLLLWRLFAYFSDKNEWEKYERDKANSKWQADNNPIFKSSVTEFENPIFD